jgi:hypothetical protein
MQASFASAPALRRRGRAFAEARSMSVPKAIEQQAKLDLPAYDVFLSQATKNREVVLGVYATLCEELRLRVFCDWLEDPTNDHAITTAREAEYLRRKLRSSTALMFIDSEHADTSTWMSWEIGWFDAAKGRICVLPVVEDERPYRGREFLGLYPVAEYDERHSFVVGVPPTKVAARHPLGTPLGIATRMPLGVWASAVSVPDYFLR